MNSSPCPYTILGVAKGCDSEDLKKAYKKLALKLHPDKAASNNLTIDEAQSKFQELQAAYELINTPENRAKYDAEATLEALRPGKKGSGADVKTARYETRTAAPAGATFTANGPPRYEERRPAYDDRKPSSRMYDEDRHYEGRGYDTYEAVPRSARSRPEKEPRTDKASSDRTRSDRAKARDKAERRDRRFNGPEEDSSGSDEKQRFEREARRRTEEASRKQQATDARRREERRSYEDVTTKEKEREREREREPRRHRSNEEHLDRARKTDEKLGEAFRYIFRTQAEAAADARPFASRSASSREIHHRDDYDRDRDRDRPSRRPEAVRRSSARPKDRPSSSSTRDPARMDPPIMEWPRDEPPPRMPIPPTFKHSSSSPADIHIPPTRATPQRSQTEQYPEHRIRVDTSPSPAAAFRRADTMPTVPSSSPYRTAPGPSSSAFPSVPPPRSGTTKKYYYTTPGGGVQLLPEQVDVANGHFTILREPGQSHTSSTRHRSPSPLSRPPIGANRPIETPLSSSSRRDGPPPPLGRSSSSYADDRGRSASSRLSEDRSRPSASGRYFGEVTPEHMLREKARQRTQFPSESVSYSPAYKAEDVRYAEPKDAGRDVGRDRVRGRERGYERESAKPTLGRHATYVY